MALGVPVVFLVFNRPDLTRESFARIRDQQPEQLFVVADGPRETHPSDIERCAAVRRIVDDIDWPCDVHRNYAEHNLGCKRRVSGGLDWVFSQVDRAIILEDDCVAHPDFFGFCDELLERYEDDPTVAMVTGDNFQEGVRRGEASYYFSRYGHIWGWATWSRAWDHYDVELSFWPMWRVSPEWRLGISDAIERRYWKRIFDRAERGDIDTWDYQWLGSMWFARGLAATPNVNLVSNTGFGPDATHTSEASDAAGQSTESIGKLAHPRTVCRDEDADRFVFDYHFGGSRRRWYRHPLLTLRWVLSRAGGAVQRRRTRVLRRHRDPRRTKPRGGLR